MNRCANIQKQLLDHLYGLLEPAQVRELEAHVEECGHCRAALDTARGHMSELARAAVRPCHFVKFEAPAPMAYPSRSHVVSLPAYRSAWRLAVAASVLVVLSILSIPSVLLSQQRERLQTASAELARIREETRTVHDDYQAKLDQARDAFDKAAAAIAALQENPGTGDDGLKGAFGELIVTGPRAPQAGAPNYYNVHFKQLADQQVQIECQVLDKDQREVDRPKVVAQNKPGEYQMALSPTLPLKPDSNFTLVVVAQTEKGKIELREKLNLVAPTYRTHLATDKPMYQPGETVRFRSLTLERFSLRPAQEDIALLYMLTKPTQEQQIVLNAAGPLRANDGSIVLGPDGQPLRGVGCGEFVIPDDAPGGEYQLTVSDDAERFPKQTRKFIVNRYEKPRMDKELEFTRKSYGPGDLVVAQCRVAPAGGGMPIANQPVIAKMSVDGRTHDSLDRNLRTDAAGNVVARFQLPKKIDHADASVTITFTDGGNHETLVRNVPLVLRRLNVEFFPEGGDLVLGVPNRMYFQARTPLGKPAELRGRIVDQLRNVVADAETFNDADNPGANQGMGVFSFTPLAGKQYELVIDSPVGLEGRHMLPEVKPAGVVLTIPQGVTDDREAIRVTVRSADKDRDLYIGAYCRGRLMDSRRLETKKGQAQEVVLSPTTGVGGVYRVTVLELIENEAHPVAERLIYRAPAESLKINVKPNKDKYVPGDPVRITCATQDEQGQAIPAVLMVGVVDQSVVKLADEKTYHGMPTHFLLTSEVRRPEDLEHADFMLTRNPKAYKALDLLLGTQGWRRFAEQNPIEFQKRNQEDAERILAMVARHEQQPLSRALSVEPSKELLEANTAMDKARLNRDKALEDVQLLDTFEHLEIKQSELEMEVRLAEASITLYESWRQSLWAGMKTMTWIFGFLAGIVLSALVVRRLGAPQAIPFAVTATCALGLFAVVYLSSHEKVRPGHDFAKAEVGVRMLDRNAVDRLEGDAGGNEPMFDQGKGVGQGFGAPPPQGFDPKAPQLDAKAAEERLGLKEMQWEGQRDKNANAHANKLKDLKKAQTTPINQAAAAGKTADFRREAFALEKSKKDARAISRAAGYKPRAELERNTLYRQQIEVLEARDADLALQPENIFRVREYAHVHQTGHGQARTDFTETVYWHPALVSANGTIDFGFDLSDSVTTYQLIAAGHTLDGRLGAATTTLEARLPIHIEPKMPIEINANDRMAIPVAVTNNSDERRTVTVRARFEGLQLEEGKAVEQITVEPGQRVRRLFRFRPTIVDGQAMLQFDAVSGSFAADAVSRKLRVVPEGFPRLESKSDMLEGSALDVVELPSAWLPGTLQCNVNVFPSTLADLQKGLDALLREPHGCFEQTSTTNYPNILILDYLKESNQARPEVVRRANELLTRGYAKLTSFECMNTAKSKKEGYEWFGGTAPPHEALTAYGLLQFRDMARVYDVDPAMLERTRSYLLSARDGKGGFRRNPRALDSFGRAPDHITDAYIVWAMTEAGLGDELNKELNAVTEKAAASEDPYFLALVSNALLNRSRRDDALPLLQKMVAVQEKDGHLNGKQTSITGSRGRDLQIETTALCVYAWLKAKQPNLFQKSVEDAIAWIGKQRGGRGGFGSTQATILALKALIAHAKASKVTAEAGELVLFVDDQEVSRLSFPAGADSTLTLAVPDPDRNLKPGKNKIRVEITGKNAFPYTLSWSYNTLTPIKASDCPVRLTTALDRDAANEGDSVRLKVQLRNTTDQGQGMAVAVIGLPAGLTIPEDMKQLKDLVKVPEDGSRPLVSAFETRERELILYWRDLAPNQQIDVSVDLICRVPGESRGTASRAYLYYDADLKDWIDPLKIQVAAK